MNFAERFRVPTGRRVRLADCDSADTCGWTKDRAVKRLAENTAHLAELQNRLYAENRRALLVVLQGMDASGKDGTIRHVFGPLNPQGCRVTSFKTPTPPELAHDFLWRIHAAVPAHGEIAVFNRSHYEDVLIVRVRNLVPRRVWSRRHAHINAFERLLTDAGTTVIKFFLHISPEEQRARLRARLADPAKNWKFNPGDLAERELWPQYIAAYEDALSRCSTRWAPWYIIPADKKWFRNLAVSEIVRHHLEQLNPQYPPPPPDLDRYQIP
ncbi:MAG: polyphosphate kinase 2 family protein [Verrucomicrobiae bacterium]|nr:polyphosphate kinase 2 family protein [Verrucomicrobiae bacterium]